ncbi:MAG TPA: efflux RND transporter periplasmic adaptor subunit, partial [Burkholderiales bacterium]|nr:efflux RND transporter periplasmic adaptor subunit [Burkholderiales bacterium]
MCGLAPLLAGCDDPHQAVASAPAQTSEPEVSIVTVAPKARAVVRELPGRIAPTRVADVRPRVSGIVVERTFSQGSEVKAGDPLYRIDPRPFEVELQSNEAALARANAVYDQAAQQARRVALLASQRATTEVENEKAIAAMRQAEADVAGRKADVARAKLNLDYATIR